MKKKSGQLTLGILFLIIFIFHFSQLKAQSEITDSLVNVRFQYLQNSLEHDMTQTRRWWYGWLVGYSAATVGQGVVFFTSGDKSTRQDMALGAATTLLGAAGQFVSPVILGHEADKLNTLPASNMNERLARLKVAEQYMAECGKREQLARSWKYHALTGVVNLGGGLITWLGFKRNVGAGIGYFALNTAITEAQIWTQPIIAKRSYEKYRRKYLNNQDDLTEVQRVSWSVCANVGGIGVKVVF